LLAFLGDDDGNVMTAGGQARRAGAWSQVNWHPVVDLRGRFVSVPCAAIDVDLGPARRTRCVLCSNPAASADGTSSQSKGVFIVSSPTAVISGARNPNAARLFAQFMVSPAAQQMIAAAGIHSSRVDIAPPPGQPALADMKFVTVDLDLIEERGRELKGRFAEIFQ
jgi:hypothetical protein